MRNFCLLFFVIFMTEFSISSCEYNSITHTLTNCKAYEEGKTSDACKDVHQMYEKWVAQQTLKAAINTYNDFMESDTGKEVTKKNKRNKR